jgi:hypothetical protein
MFGRAITPAGGGAGSARQMWSAQVLQTRTGVDAGVIAGQA